MSRTASGRRGRRLAAQLPDVASELARLVDTGSTLRLAVEELASTIHPPAATELSAVVDDVAHGATLTEALGRWADRSGRRDVGLLVAACHLGIANGGNLPVALEGVSAALNDSLELADEARALSTQARTSAVALMVLPILGLGLFVVLDPSIVTFLIATPPGWVLLAVGGALDLAGVGATAAIIRRALR